MKTLLVGWVRLLKRMGVALVCSITEIYWSLVGSGGGPEGANEVTNSLGKLLVARKVWPEALGVEHAMTKAKKAEQARNNPATKIVGALCEAPIRWCMIFSNTESIRFFILSKA